MFDQKKSYFISEIAQAHEGSLLLAHSMIEEAKKSGFDAVKFQLHLAEEESTSFDRFRIRLPYLPDSNRYDYWKRMEFSEDSWKELYEHSRELDLDFICSPFSIKAVNDLEKTGCDIYKIGSGEFYNLELINHLITIKKPLLISTGLSKIDEIKKLKDYIKSLDSNIPLCFLHCTTSYPTPIEKIGISNIKKLKKKLSSDIIGFSDHSADPRTIIAGYFNEARIFEVHTTFSKNIIGFDTSSSITFEEAKKMITDIRYFEELSDRDISKDDIAHDLLDLKELFTRSIVANRTLKKGMRISREFISFKKPGDGLKPNEIDKILGKVLITDIKAGSQIKLSDIV